jgi:hypothetical protein
MGPRTLICGVVVAVAMIASPAHAGFDDFAADERVVPPSTNSFAPDADEIQQLFDLSTESQDDQAPLYVPPAVELRQLPPAVSAPLPPALLPGAALILGNWIFAKKLKKRLK